MNTECLTCGDTGRVWGDTLRTDGMSWECTNPRCDAAKKRNARDELGKRALKLLIDMAEGHQRVSCAWARNDFESIVAAAKALE